MRMSTWAAALVLVVRRVDRAGRRLGCVACGRCSTAGQCMTNNLYIVRVDAICVRNDTLAFGVFRVLRY